MRYKCQTAQLSLYSGIAPVYYVNNHLNEVYHFFCRIYDELFVYA
ncbi:hypothetical protein EPYR_02367 [Erwinia pyrifoliae DSM 12163]|nr:hypothetical protein EPYR_02367 [Erwinia pyrifoliae DSM 12163]